MPQTNAPKPRLNGRVLTAKQLPEAAYQAIHTLPKGTRQKTLVALLLAASKLARKDKAWFEKKLTLAAS